MKEPNHMSLHELGADARVARIFRWSAMAAAVLTLVVAVGLLVWWWLSRDTPVAVDEIAVLPPEPLARPGVEAQPALRFTDITAQAGIDFTHFNGGSNQLLRNEPSSCGTVWKIDVRDGAGAGGRVRRNGARDAKSAPDE